MVAAAFASDPEAPEPVPPVPESLTESAADPRAESVAESAAWDQPTAPRARFGLTAPAARGLATLAVGAVAGSAVVLALGWPRGDAAPSSATMPVISGSAPAGPLGQTSAPATDGQVVVDVAGLVRRPGVFELPAGSRVIDALKAAGGSRGRGDTSSLNLAQVLTDGQQVLVLKKVEQLAAPGGAATTVPGSGSGLVNINTATLGQLDTLPGVGPVLAQAIIDWRTQNGSFTAVEQLTEVSGIGDVTFAELQPLVTV